MKTVKTALGMIVKSLDSDTELLYFLENAEKYGHKIDCVIVAYSVRLDPMVEAKISRKLPFHAIDIRNPGFCRDGFDKRGVSAKTRDRLLVCPYNVDGRNGTTPYGFNRTVVTIEAIMRDVDVLFFVDSDVHPSVLKQTPEGPVCEDVDFFGAHLAHLNAGSQITTGEYSGYNILPPAEFDGMDDLLRGLQKADMLEFWQTSASHRCLTYQPASAQPQPCTKILGGNTAIKLSVFQTLPPFFSSYYTVDGALFLCRGEDTVLGAEIGRSGVVCTDVGLNPLHDTYMSFPAEPDLRGDPAVQQRFYYACTGWVGRNPFLNYIRGADLKTVRVRQREELEKGLGALAAYTSNPVYTGVIKNFDISWDSLNRYIEEYERTLEAWDEFRNRNGK